MPFLCPDCKNPASLIILKSIELPPDYRSDEIALQLIICTNCDFKGIAVYEESRRGRLGEESIEHNGYNTDNQSISLLKKLINKCPTPMNKNCKCKSHQKLGAHNSSGRYIGLSYFNLGNQFVIE